MSVKNLCIVQVHSAKDLPNKDVLGKSDPYCKVHVCRHAVYGEEPHAHKPVPKGHACVHDSFKTEKINDTDAPQWHTAHTFVLDEGTKIDQVMFEVWDWDKWSKDDLIGGAVVNLDWSEAAAGFQKSKHDMGDVVPLWDTYGAQAGELSYRIQVLPRMVQAKNEQGGINWMQASKIAEEGKGSLIKALGMM
eukprot:g2462.t1